MYFVILQLTSYSQSPPKALSTDEVKMKCWCAAMYEKITCIHIHKANAGIALAVDVFPLNVFAYFFPKPMLSVVIKELWCTKCVHKKLCNEIMLVFFKSVGWIHSQKYPPLTQGLLYI